MSARKSLRGLIPLVLGVVLLAIALAAPAVNTLWTQHVLTTAQARSQANAKAAIAAKTAQNKVLAAAGLVPNADVFAAAKGDPDAAAHLVGQVSIPKLALVVPLFDVSSPALLQQGAVVVPGTSFPSGDPNTHAVIAAHDGLFGNELFTHLDRLTLGDRFLVTIGATTRTYAIERRLIVAPTRTDVLRIEPGRELVTLLTCTPYMVNTERLLVTAHRVPTLPAASTPKQVATLGQTRAWLTLAAVLLALMALAFWGWRHRVAGRNR
ncbi:class C sortase [Lacticaseibacillus kribbianus]|uniref:class C sortase n=1 Tax=Lacticaseibacillus kribbianus TaxID=2926292 RepID=UPI001CD3A3BF|nr:class C sortase [Lacticaseibacillus kribbianus]